MKRIQPEKDRIYAITLNNLGCFVVGEEGFCSEDNFADELADGKSIDECYTLLRYDGNGRFIEYYSGEVVLLCTEYSNEELPKTGILAFANTKTMLEAMSENDFEMKKAYLITYPLFVDAANLKDVSMEVVASINYNSLAGNHIREYISEHKKFAVKELMDGVYHNVKEDIDDRNMKK